MCGIAGVLGPDPERLDTALRATTSALAHRGPDWDACERRPFGEGCWLGFGHRRLAIIDLSPTGRQPMTHLPTGSQLVFNGEVYNHAVLRRELERAGETFRGHSDTEVLLAALARWGTDALGRLEGMFALAFYEAPRRRLILARDPTGINPLYVGGAAPWLVFASEVRALLASGLVPPRLDRRGLAGLLAYGAVQHPCTLADGVRSLPPGSWQEFVAEAGGWRTGAPQRYWDFPRPRAGVAEREAVATVRDTLSVGVRDHLMSDVPLGVFLSSGTDSTIIAGLAAKHAPGLQSFTVGFADAPDLSEQALAAETARVFGLSHTDIPLTFTDAEAAARRWLNALDQPSVDGLNVFVVSEAVRARGIKVALSGLGGDELFGGYPSFRDVPRLARMLGRVRWLPATARRAAAGVLAVGRPRAVRHKLGDMFGGRGDLRSLYLQRRRAMSGRQLAELGLDADELGLTPDFLTADATPPRADLEADPVWSVSVLESEHYMANMLLRDADANGLAHALEIRVPFLDRRLLDTVHALPGAVRLPAGAPGKFLLKRAFPDLLRPELARQGKRGFTLPIRRWMLGPLRDVCEQALAYLKGRDVLRPAGIVAVWSAFLAEPESPIWSRAFTLCVLGHYLETQRLA